MNAHTNRERQRLQDSLERKSDWKNWGPYLSERAWGTVREDYSPDGSAWDYFPHDHARSRAYRWSEDGLGGFCNRFQNICLAVGLWNERDPILKERLFGITGSEGNHGEDVKEYYYYLDSTPTHSYMKMLYKYPQVEYPYADLVETNRRRPRNEPEYELIDALRSAFEEHRYFDVFIEYAKAEDEDILWRITAVNRGPEPAPIHILPQMWHRNVWSWRERQTRPQFHRTGGDTLFCNHRHLGRRWLHVTDQDGTIDVNFLFTENESNAERLWGVPNSTPYTKDAFHEYIVNGRRDAVNPAAEGSKAAAHFRRTLGPGESYSVYARLVNYHVPDPFEDFLPIFAQRIEEADEFYESLHPKTLDEDEKRVQRQALAGLLWSKQFYHYSVELWLDGDPAFPKPPGSRHRGRNNEWRHVYNLEVLSMPDKWEYPWFAAWDLAFHCVPLALVDLEWAKRQLVLLLREWYMHPNGQIPAYEWAFGDVNPPVHAWAAWEVYRIEKERTGEGDTEFLEKVFHKLMLNFTWWVNRKDAGGNNIFQGGFLGLDNIGVFDRSAPLPTGGYLEQADGTSWMAMYCLNMLQIALELGVTLPAYEDVATKFFEHFIYIAHAINHMGGTESGLWENEEGFFFDMLNLPNSELIPMKVRSFVGLIPLFATQTLDELHLTFLPRFKSRMEWFLKYRPALIQDLRHTLLETGADGTRLLAIVDRKKLERVFQSMFDTERFLSPYGLRSLSKEHDGKPYEFRADGRAYTVHYEPAESSTGLFGGNSNWRGPIWFPVNFLMIQALRMYHRYYGDSFKIEVPTGSGVWMNLDEAANELSRRMTRLFLRDEEHGRRPTLGHEPLFQQDPHWRDHILFYEYFNGNDGSGVGASHQTGWTALVATLLSDIGALRERETSAEPSASE